MPSKSYATAKMVLVLDGREKTLDFLLGEEGYGAVLFSFSWLYFGCHAYQDSFLALPCSVQTQREAL